MSAAQIEIGSAAIPEANSPIPVTPVEQIQRSLEELAAQREPWIDLGIPERIKLLKQMRRDMLEVAPSWVEAACAAKRIPRGTPTEGEEWFAGPFTVIRNLRLFQRSLEDLLRHGRTMPPGEPVTRPGDLIAVPVFPSEIWDKIFFTGMSAEVWMDPSVNMKNIHEHTGMIYRQKANGERETGKIALVLGAGNVASIGPMDALYKLFCEDQVVVLKTNPVNAYLAPFIEKGFRALIEADYLRIVVGGAEEGKLLCEHELVEEIHITGSDKTHDTIVFGGGEEGARRKAEGERLNERRITSELGNVSPVIVVPGPWTPKDFAFQGMNLASMLTNNGGFNCNATRVIITSEGWSGREPLLQEIRNTLNAAPTRYAYYPGAQD
ncbi:MAG: aldehyde dehydrogenase family protein, partial [Myxococcota bacterium]|nr:aldehyde dehydrogenase family protein [Myxococcota bacterium]